MLLPKKRRRMLILYLILLLSIVLLYQIRMKIKSILAPFFVAIILAYLLDPLVNYIELNLEKVGIFKKISPRLPAVIILFVMATCILVFLGWSIVPALIIESKRLFAELPNYVEEIQGILVSIRESSLKQLPDGFNEIVDMNIKRFEGIIINSLQNILMIIVDFFSRILNIIMIPVLTFYFLKDKNYFISRLNLLIPRRWKPSILEIAKKSDRVIGNFVRGRIIVAVFIGIFTGVGLQLIGIHYALVIGMIAGILDIIPYFGPVIGAVPAVILAFLQEPIKVIWVVVLFFIVQQVEGDIIAPKIIGENVGLHPVAVILSLLIGGTFFGIIGMIIAVPLAAIFKVIIEYIANYIGTNDMI